MLLLSLLRKLYYGEQNETIAKRGNERDYSSCEFLSEDVPLVHQGPYPLKPNIHLKSLQTDLYKYS